MSRRLRALFSLLAAVLLCAVLLPGAAALAENHAPDYSVTILTEEDADRPSILGSTYDASQYTEEAVYARLMDMTSSYPEGMPWTNDNSYQNVYLWHGGKWDGYYLRYTGYGCAGFVLIMSDAAFGSDLPVWQDYDVKFSKIRVGDILRINNDSHSVIVLRVNQDSVTIAEGNYNSSIHWGRTLSAQDVERADYLLTRWPGVPQSAATYTVAYDANYGDNAPADQTKTHDEALTLSDAVPTRAGWYFLGWSEDADAVEAAYLPGGSFTLNADATLYAVWAKPDFTLPAALESIGEEAFMNSAFRFAALPENTAEIQSRAFSGCGNLKYLCIPSATVSIDWDAFDGVNGLTIIGPRGGDAQSFAQQMGFAFVPAG